MRRFVLIVVLGLSACSDDGGALDAGGMADACDPLTGMERPIALGDVLAVGRDADGVVYVLEQPPDDGDLRAFVSDGDALVRHRVSGSGSGTQDGITFYDVDVEADPDFKLYLEIPDGGEPSFSKLVTDQRNSPDAAAEGEQLELLTEDVIADFELQNLPAEVFIEYFGELEDGRKVLVTRPEDDWSYEDFRVFLGQDTRVLERDVQSVLRARDGGSTTIELTLDGEPATLSFPVMSVDGQIEPGAWTLELGGEVQAIERLEPVPDALDGLSFFCL